MLKHETHKNTKVATQFGEVTFNEKGESTDLTETQEKVLDKLPGYAFVGKEKPKAEPKEETKAPAKKTTTRKTTATKKAEEPKEEETK